MLFLTEEKMPISEYTRQARRDDVEIVTFKPSAILEIRHG